MTVQIKWKTLGMVETNAFLVGDTDTNEAILIDPVDNAPALVEMAKAAGWTIKLILATHAHFDHVLASKELKELTDAPFYIHEEAAPHLGKLPQRGLMFSGQLFPKAAEPDKLLGNDDVIEMGAIRLQSLYTPGHAPGHLSFYLQSENTVFCGDALFAGSIGRTDLEGGSLQVLMNSIKTKLLTLPDDTRALCGHGPETTIGRERTTNPFIRQYL